MSRFIGGLVNVGLSRETVRGTTPGAAPTFWTPWVDFTFDDKPNYVYSDEAMGVIDETHEAKITERYGEGNFGGEVRLESIGLVLYALMGSLSTAIVEAGEVFDHTFSLAQSNQHTSLSLFVSEDNNEYRFPLAMISTFDLNLDLNAFVSYVSGFISKKSVDTTIAAASYSEEDKFTARNANVKFAANLAAVDAASTTKIQSLTLSVEKNILRKHVLGTIDAYDILNKVFSVSGTFQLPYEDTTFKGYVMDGTDRAMLIDLEDSNTTIGAGSNPRLRIYLPKVTLEDWTPERAKGELYEQTISFKGKRDVSGDNSTISSIVLRNTTDSY